MKNLLLGIGALLLLIPACFIGIYVADILMWVQQVWLGMDGLIVEYGPSFLGGLIAGAGVTYLLGRWMTPEKQFLYRIPASILPVVGIIGSTYFFDPSQPIHWAGIVNGVGTFLGVNSTID